MVEIGIGAVELQALLVGLVTGLIYTAVQNCVHYLADACAMLHPSQAAALPPLPDALVAHGEPAQQYDLAEIPQCQPVAQPAQHHERDDVAR
jgi:hypothetical protein